MELRIASLWDHRELVATIARWHWEEWGHVDPEGSLDAWTDALGRRTHRDRIPTAFVALEGSTPMGSAVLVEHDMATRPDLSPWLAGVFVVPERRGRGVASRLVEHAEARAADFGATTLYLYTRHAERLYRRLGWRRIGREHYEGGPVSLMSRDLRA